MKIAIILYGQARKLCTSLLEKLDKQNIVYDVYIHYWEPDDDNFYRKCGLINNKNNIKIKENINEDIIKCYKPKKIKHEKQKYFDLPSNITSYELGDPQHLCSRLYSQKESFELIENITEYDLIISSRFDLDLFDDFPDLNKLEKNVIYFSKFHKDDFPYDLFWIVPVKYSNIFCIFDELNEIGISGVPERMLKYYLNKNNISYKSFNVNCEVSR